MFQESDLFLEENQWSPLRVRRQVLSVAYGLVWPMITTNSFIFKGVIIMAFPLKDQYEHFIISLYIAPHEQNGKNFEKALSIFSCFWST